MVFEECPTTKLENEHWKAIILNSFPILENVTDSKHLSLKEYIEERPQKFYNKKVFDDYLNFLVNLKNTKPKLFLTIYKEIENELNIAIKSLDELNSLEIHDIFIPDDNIETISFIDNSIHFNYLKLSEAVYHKFIYPIAYSNRLERNKQTDKLDIYNCIEEVKTTQFSYVTTCYHNTIRNGIAHGGITYKEQETIYKGKKGSPYEIRTKKIIRMFDDLLDICNGFSLAFKMFFILNREFFTLNKLNSPNNFLISELKAQANSPDWKVVSCLESFNIKNQKQLNIITENSLLDYSKVNYHAFRTAVLAEYFASGFDRYFISLKSKYSLPGWASYNGKILKRERLSKSENVNGYAGVLEENLLFFIPKYKLPKFLLKLIGFWTIFKVNYPLEFHKATNYSFIKQYEFREAKPFKRKLFVINNDPSLVFFNDNPEYIIDTVRNKYKKIVRFTIRKSKRKLKPKFARLLRTRYIRVTLYDTDLRKRNLRSSGLIDNLICSITINTTKQVKNIDFIGGKVEQYGKYRIVWNKNWKGIKHVC